MVECSLRRARTLRRVAVLVIAVFLPLFLLYVTLQERSLKAFGFGFLSKYFDSRGSSKIGRTKERNFNMLNESKHASEHLSNIVSKNSTEEVLDNREQAGIGQKRLIPKYIEPGYTQDSEHLYKDGSFSEDTGNKLDKETHSTEQEGGGRGTLKKRLPNCLIFGTRKSGTTALMTILDIHPKIHLSTRERHFFIAKIYDKGFEEFRSYMPLSYEDDITIEKSADYFPSEIARKRIYDYKPDIKLIVTVKHPVTRAIADYRQFRQVHPWLKESFQEFVTKRPTGEFNLTSMPLNASVYVEHLKKWYAYFPREQIHIVDGEKLITDPLEEVRLVEDFLGLKHEITSDHVKFVEEKGFFCMRKHVTSNFQCLSKLKGGMPKPDVDPKFEQRLRDFYHPYNEQFFELINRRFDWE